MSTRLRRSIAAPALAATLAGACRRPAPTRIDVPPVATSTSIEDASSAIASARAAEDRRDPRDVPPNLSSSRSVAARRASARAFAEIGGNASIDALERALGDEDPETVAWAAYGLALPCALEAGSDDPLDPESPRQRAERRARVVRALVARAVALDEPASLPRSEDRALRPWETIAWGLGRCGGSDASKVLVRWLVGDIDRARSAALALGAIASREHGLEDDVALALIAAAQNASAIDEALYPFSRGDWSGRAKPPSLAAAVRARLLIPSPARIFAIRASGRGEGVGVSELRPLLVKGAATPPEIVETLRALHRLGEDGDAEIAAFATRMAPVSDETTAALMGDGFGPLRVAVELLAERASTTSPSPTIETSLGAFLPASGAPIAMGLEKPLVRRLATLRCTAAAGLHPGVPSAQALAHCADVSGGATLEAIRDDARLDAASRRDLDGARRDVVVQLAKTGSPRVRERAIEKLADHAESGALPTLVAELLAAKELGLIAATAEAIATRPSIAFGANKSDERAAIRRALDPKAPPPSLDAPRPLAPADEVLHALETAMARPFEDADVEARMSLARAAAALRDARARPFIDRLCGDRSEGVRRTAAAALRALDAHTAADACELPLPSTTTSPLDERPRTVALDTDVGLLKLHLDARFAPRIVARLGELASSGFFDGTPIHRVAPAFVVQLGDPGGDGYGGAHIALRCETAPLAFERLDIGLALAGRDTGSSQIFVMLARAPHLDGAYSWLGRAEGDWDAVAEGDVIRTAKIE